MATLGSSKSNVMAIVPEITEGTPLDPRNANDYLALQPNVTFTPSFDLLNNEEIRASIGKTKSIQGLEKPNLTFSHYLKHSAVEGTPPEISDVLEGIFGTTSSNTVERTTTVASSISVLLLGSGGTDFARGKAVLIKDATNTYRIRPVLSVATNSVFLGFNLPIGTAPATGILLGKCINYAPANSGHRALTAWLYRGNGQATEAMTGAKMTEFGISVAAGQFVNATFKMEGTKYYFNPIRTDSASYVLDWQDDSGAYTASVTQQLWRDPYELADSLQTAFNSTISSQTHTVTYQGTGGIASPTGKYLIATSGTIFTLKWNTGSNTAASIASKIGFSTAANSTAATSYTSTNAQSYASPFIPSYDNSDPLAAKYQEVLLGDSTDSNCFETSNIQFTMTDAPATILSICAQSGVNSRLITAREVKVTLTALLDKHEADKFRRFRANSDTSFCYNFGTRSGGNWVGGKCGSLYMPTCTISNISLIDVDTVVALQLELSGFVDSSGNGEIYLNFL